MCYQFCIRDIRLFEHSYIWRLRGKNIIENWDSFREGYCWSYWIPQTLILANRRYCEHNQQSMQHFRTWHCYSIRRSLPKGNIFIYVKITTPTPQNQLNYPGYVFTYLLNIFQGKRIQSGSLIKAKSRREIQDKRC